MRTLKKQIADTIIAAYDENKLPAPERWRLQVPASSSYGKLVLFFDITKHSDPFERSRIRDYKQLEVSLPDGYSDHEYEEALEEIFPNTISNDDTVPQYNSSVRVISRKLFEDSLVAVSR